MIEVLLDAKELLNRGWTTKAFARDANGTPVPVMSERAVSFCLLAAISRAAGRNSFFCERIESVLCECISGSLADWNDRSTFEEVIACIDETIATLRSREGAYA